MEELIHQSKNLMAPYPFLLDEFRANLPSNVTVYLFVERLSRSL